MIFYTVYIYIWMDLRVALEQMLSNNNSLRQSAEGFYNELVISSPSELIRSLIHIFKDSSSQIKCLIAILLRQLVDPLSAKEIWSKIGYQFSYYCKNIILEVLKLEIEQKPCELLCEVVSKLAINIYSSNGTWPEIINFIKLGLESNNYFASLEILGSIYIYIWKDIVLIPKKINNFLLTNDFFIKYAAIKAISSMLSVMKNKTANMYSESVPILLTSCFNILSINEYSGTKCLEFIIDIAECKSFLFANQLIISYNFFYSVKNLSVSTSTKLLCAEFIIILYENVQDLETITSKNLLTDVFEIMIQSDYIEDESWQVPEEGFNEEQSELEIDYAKQGSELISRLIQSVGDKELLEPTLSLVHECLSNSFWKFQYSALIAIGEIIPFVIEPKKIIEIIQICMSACSADNPKLRAAGYYLIKDLSQNCIQVFQATYHHLIFSVILAGCKDSIPRVRVQALSALTSFILGADNYILVSYTSYIPYLLSLFHGQISLVIEYSIKSISAFAKKCKKQFIDYYQETINELLALLLKSKHGVYSTLRGKIIECISLCSVAVGKQMFATKINIIIQAITTLEVHPDQEILSYLLNSWQNICEILQEDFSEYLDNIVPSLLKFISGPNEETKISTIEMANKEQAMQTLSKFVNILKGKYWKYLDDTLRVALPYINYTLNDNLRAIAAEILASLVQAKKNLQEPSAFAHAQELAKVFIELLVKAASEEFNKDAFISQIEAISKILEVLNASFLSQSEINEIGELSLQTLLKKAKSGYNSEDSEIFLTITSVIRAIFKSHPYLTSQILSTISSSVIPKLMIESKQKELQKYALYIIDDAIEYLSTSHQADKWDDIISMLLCYANDSNDILRQSAVYGLGVYAEKNVNFAEKSPMILSALFFSLEICSPALPPARTKSYGHARDNSISAIGKIIKYQSQSIDVSIIIDKWIRLLPLKWDKTEAIITNELLADLLEWKSELVLHNSEDNFLKVLEIIADISNTKFINEQSMEKFNKFLRKYNQEIKTIIHKLSKIQQERILLLYQIN